jgi:hypothetical protein
VPGGGFLSKRAASEAVEEVGAAGPLGRERGSDYWCHAVVAGAALHYSMGHFGMASYSTYCVVRVWIACTVPPAILPVLNVNAA